MTAPRPEGLVRYPRYHGAVLGLFHLALNAGVVWLAFGSGCGAATQQIIECTQKQRQKLADPLADFIRDDIGRGQRVPSEFLVQVVQDFAAQYGVAFVRCGLQELIGLWQRELEVRKSLWHERAIALAEALLQEVH